MCGGRPNDWVVATAPEYLLKIIFQIYGDKGVNVRPIATISHFCIELIAVEATVCGRLDLQCQQFLCIRLYIRVVQRSLRERCSVARKTEAGHGHVFPGPARSVTGLLVLPIGQPPTNCVLETSSRPYLPAREIRR